jgi:hypothetical protein
MIVDRFAHPSSSRLCARLVPVTLMLSLTALALASSAVAGTPTGVYAPFADCPLGTPNLTKCIYSQTTSGEFKIGSTSVPVNQTLVLQGGTIPKEGSTPQRFVNAADGNTLSKTALTVPGGLLSIMAPEALPEPLKYLFEEYLINKGPTGVTATAELVGSVGISTANLFIEEGVALTLPVRIHLSNLFLGESCYIGSAAHPVTFNLTTGETSPPAPNKPIHGKTGEVELSEEGNLVTITDDTLVDNAFSAPEVEGCGGLLSFLLDPVIDAKIGLPAASGNNTAILNNKIEQAETEAVEKSE